MSNEKIPTFHESKQFAADNVQVALVDIDETVCFYPNKRQYDLAEPHKKNIAKINAMYDSGWKIIYWTARGGSDKSKAAGRCYYDYTWKQLESWGCKFHDLSTGSKGDYIKPACDLVIDDKAKRIEELDWTDLAPDICRQRIVVEGTLHNSFKPEDMKRYCSEISRVLNMTPIGDPKTDYAEEYGWCCFQHWKESGMHIYGWDMRSPKFFSIDIYTCKSFDPQHVVNYTNEFFGDNLIKLAWKE